MTTHTENTHANKRTVRALLKTAMLNLFRVTEDNCKVAVGNELTAFGNSNAICPFAFTQTCLCNVNTTKIHNVEKTKCEIPQKQYIYKGRKEDIKLLG